MSDRAVTVSCLEIVQNHADKMYALVPGTWEDESKKKAMWHAHEISKYLAAAIHSLKEDVKE